MMFNATKQRVEDQGRPPDSFLLEQVEWARTIPSEIYAPIPNRNAPGPDPDVFVLLKAKLGPWENLLHRLAALLELQRVHAGFESSWSWIEGVDRTNKTSMTHKEGEETGIFQVSFDSLELGGGAMKPFAVSHGIGTVGSFITKMKTDHKLALEYYSRLVRISYAWAGPIKRHEIVPWLSRDAVKEYITLLG